MKKISKFLSSIFVFSALIFSSVVSLEKGNIDSVVSLNSQETSTKSISASNVTDDIENLEFSINKEDKTVSYDVTFKTNEFDGTTTNSVFYVQDGDFVNPWIKASFIGSTATVQNRHASNTASYIQIFTLPEQVYIRDGGVRMNLVYGKDENTTAAATKPFIFYLSEDLVTVDNTKTFMTVNETNDYAEIDFSFQNEDNVSLESVKLKSSSNENINQSIYSSSMNYELFQGDNRITFELLDEEHYYDLYLEFTFDDWMGASYTANSEISSDIDFISAKAPEATWNVQTIILVILIVLLILLTIIFIVFIVLQIQKRRNLEKLNKENYYQDHLENN